MRTTRSDSPNRFTSISLRGNLLSEPVSVAARIDVIEHSGCLMMHSLIQLAAMEKLTSEAGSGLMCLPILIC